MARRFVPGTEGSAGGGDVACFVVEHVQDCAVVACAGEIDMSTVPAMRAAMQQAQRSSRRLVVDLTGVTFLDSSGVGVILAALKTGRTHPEAQCLAGASGLVLRVLTITGLTELVPVFASVQEAVTQSV